MKPYRCHSYSYRIISTVLLILTVSAAGASQLIWDENFSDNRNGWFEDGSRMRVTNGRYEFYSEGNDAYSWRSTPFRNGIIEVDTQWVGERDTHGYGVIFRFVDSGNFYFFWLAGQGYYVVGKAVNGSAQLIKSWTYSQKVSPHGSNTMKVEMSGEDFSCFINGERVYDFTDSSYAEGGFGFYTQQGVYAAFDNVKVWENDTVSTSTASIPSEGLLAHWFGGEEILNGNNIRQMNGAVMDGEILNLSAASSQYALLDPSQYDLYDGYTISLGIRFNSWANDGRHADNQYILEWTNDVPYDLRSYIMRLQILGDYNYSTSPHELAAGIGRSAQYYKTGVTPELNTWYRITLVYEGKKLLLYLDDDKLLDTTFSGNVPSSSSKDIYIGRHMHPSSSIGYFGDFSLSESYLWDRALSEEEVMMLGGTQQAEVIQEEPQVQPQQVPQPSQPAQPETVQSSGVPDRFTTFGDYHVRGSFGGSVYLKDIFHKEAYPVYLAFFPVKRVSGSFSSKDIDDYVVDGNARYYAATNANGFYHLDLPEGSYLGIPYNEEGLHWELVTGEEIFKVSPTMKVHHYKIDNTKNPIAEQQTASVSVKGKVLDSSQGVYNMPVKAYLISSLDDMELVLTSETVSDYSGNFSLSVPPDSLCLFIAGVSQEEFASGQGRYGSAVIDLALEESEDVIIVLEN